MLVQSMNYLTVSRFFHIWKYFCLLFVWQHVISISPIKPIHREDWQINSIVCCFIMSLSLECRSFKHELLCMLSKSSTTRAVHFICIKGILVGRFFDACSSIYSSCIVNLPVASDTIRSNWASSWNAVYGIVSWHFVNLSHQNMNTLLR